MMIPTKLNTAAHKPSIDIGEMQSCVMFGWPAPNHIRKTNILNYSHSSISKSIRAEKPGINIPI